MSLETFTPKDLAVEAGGKRLSIVPLRVRDLAGFARAIDPAMPLILAERYQAAVAHHGPAMIAAVAIGAHQDEDWVADLPPDEFLRLAAAVLEVNLDFFARRVLPVASQIGAQIAGLTAEIRAQAGTSGDGSSPGSRDGDTGSTTSSG